MPDGPYATLAGLVLAQLGRLPEVGERVEVNGWTLTVHAVRGRRIDQVRITAPLNGQEPASSEARTRR
jgi:CBS domain containing-hemolysin-like protein